MEENRSREFGPIPPRNSRFFQHGEYWFYTTRECSIIGPYESLHDAMQGCRKFLNQVKSISDYHNNQSECA